MEHMSGPSSVATSMEPAHHISGPPSVLSNVDGGGGPASVASSVAEHHIDVMATADLQQQGRVRQSNVSLVILSILSKVQGVQAKMKRQRPKIFQNEDFIAFLSVSMAIGQGV